jgi:hypothetical protein
MFRTSSLICLIVIVIFFIQTQGLRPISTRFGRHCPNADVIHIEGSHSKISKLHAAEVIGANLPTIPILIGSIAVVFGVFNINNDVDLTDAGRAKARAKRRAEGPTIIDKGKRLRRITMRTCSKSHRNLSGLKSIGIELPQEDDSVDIVNKGGGCG